VRLPYYDEPCSSPDCFFGFFSWGGDTVSLVVRREEPPFVSYASWGPFQVEWGDGTVFRVGRCWLAFNLKIGRS
jgi:hypothetical protein